MTEDDANQKALDQVEKATDSEPVKGEDLLQSEVLKRQLRELKGKEIDQSGNIVGEKPI